MSVAGLFFRDTGSGISVSYIISHTYTSSYNSRFHDYICIGLCISRIGFFIFPRDNLIETQRAMLREDGSEER